MNYKRIKNRIDQGIVEIYHFLINQKEQEPVKKMRENASGFIYGFIPTKYSDKVDFVKSYYSENVNDIENVEDERLVHDVVHYHITKMYFDALDNFFKNEVKNEN